MSRGNGLSVDECARFLERAKTRRRPRQLLEYFSERMREMGAGEGDGGKGGGSGDRSPTRSSCSA